jgi:recombination protein RecT
VEVTPRPAATLLLIRPGKIGLEVLMVERPARGFFGGLWVFPGGGVDAIDDSADARLAVDVPEDCDDFPWRAAALRETLEEVGLALTDSPLPGPLLGPGGDIYLRLSQRGIRLDGRRLRLLSQWVTPTGAPTRFDARFYLARVAGDPDLVLQQDEIVSHAWVTPRSALERVEANEWAMVTPTIIHLQWLDRFPDIDQAWQAAVDATGSRVEPILERDGSEVRVRLPAAAELP